MSTNRIIRTFIALELTEAAITDVGAVQADLKPRIPRHAVRWAVLENIHLTLHFLGNMPLERVPDVVQAMQTTAAATSPFELTLAKIGCFPGLSRPRIIWAGVTGQTEQLRDVHARLGEQLQAHADFTPESRPYSPHLTLGRVQKDCKPYQLRQVGETLTHTTVGQMPTLPVTHLCLYQSDLRPTGPVYTVLERVPLSA